jgi:hypothetical protein
MSDDLETPTLAHRVKLPTQKSIPNLMSIGQGVFVLHGTEVGGVPSESIMVLTILASATARSCD